MQNVNFMRLNYQKLFALFLLLIFILPSEPAQKCPFRGIRNLRIQSKLASKHFAKVKNLPDKLCQLLPWCSCHFLPLSFLPIRMLWQFETSSFAKNTKYNIWIHEHDVINNLRSNISDEFYASESSDSRHSVAHEARVQRCIQRPKWPPKRKNR